MKNNKQTSGIGRYMKYRNQKVTGRSDVSSQHEQSGVCSNCGGDGVVFDYHSNHDVDCSFCDGDGVQR
jgi:DnaJ-class molecular chaperone